MLVTVSSGRWRGKKLSFCSEKFVRPTAGKIRQAIFNMLRKDLPEACFIDLFAGSGAMGIEALSNGATTACWIEKNIHEHANIKKNLAQLGASDKAKQVFLADVFLWLKNSELKNFLLKVETCSLIVFMDPPYQLYDLPELLELVKNNIIEAIELNHAEMAVLLCLECHVNDLMQLKSISFLNLEDQKIYSETAVVFYSLNV